MTNKLTGVKPPMELDINSFLDSDTDSGSDSPSVPHRTVDEILNASDSSSASSSPPLSPPSVRDNILRQTRQDLSCGDSGPRLNDAVRPESVKTGRFARVSDPIRRVSPSTSSSSSRQLPSLFAGVRSNAKPGAALAAAAAASRSVPTPHAAIIKSRRASSASSGTLQKVLEESVSNAGEEDREVSSSNGDSVGVGAGSNVSADDFRSSYGEFPRVDEESDFGIANEAKEAELKEVRISVISEALTDAHDSEGNSKLESVDASTSCGYDIEGDFTGKRVSTALEAESTLADSIDDENMIVASMEKVSESQGLYDSDEKSILSSLADNTKGSNEEDSTARELRRDESDTVMPSSNNNGVDAHYRDDGSSTTDISELVEERIKELEKERMNKREEKKRRSFRKPLDLAEEFEKKQAYTGLHWEEGAAAQPMRLEGVKTGSTTLGYFDVNADNFITRTISSQPFKRDHGSPQVLAVHLNFIAVGMSKGVILVVPSKYSSHSADQMDPKMTWLGLQGERSQAPVTSICFNQQGDLLLAGYGDGHVTVWDMQRASAAKVITGEHTAPVVHTLFLGRDSQGSRQFKAITSDTKGLVFLHTFSGVLLLNMYSVKTQCLLDGQKNGTVLSASPLLLDESCGSYLPSSQGSTAVSSSSIASMMGGVVGVDSGWKLFNEGSSLVEEGVVIFVTYQTALVVRLIPNLEVYAQLSRPEGVREGSMPYTAWKCTMQCHDSSGEKLSKEAADRVSLLAIAWDRKVQVSTLVKSELKGYAKWSLDSAAIGVVWLDDQMLVIPTVTGHLYLFAKDGTMIHQTNFSIDGSAGDNLVSYHTYFTNIFGNPEKAYHNSVSARGASIYILGTMHLVISRLLPWKERINVLRRAGDWIGALNMAMTLYDGRAHGVVDLPKTVDAVREAIAPSLVELLLSYVEEVFSYISIAFLNQIDKTGANHEPSSGSNSVHSEVKEQYNRVGGVAVEFCVHIKRMDLLFDEIFSKFVAVQQRDTFLELLEPYILKDMLGSLPPEIMQALVEHYSSKGWLQRVEQCVLHMDISSLDFNQVVRICREHGLYGALVYLFNKGLDDFRSPLEELMMVLQNSEGERATSIGYRMLVYLKYCFRGLAFPPGHGNLPPTRLPSLRTELIQFLLENSNAHSSNTASHLTSGGAYLNLYHLLDLDTEATLDVLRCAFAENETLDHGISQLESGEGSLISDREESMPESGRKDILVQNLIDALICILDGLDQPDEPADTDDTASDERWPCREDMSHLFEFVAYYAAHGRATIPKRVLERILDYLTSEDHLPNSNVPPKNKEKQLLNLLKVVPNTDWDAAYALKLCEKSQFYQVCGYIHTIRQQYLAALDCYVRNVDEPIHAFCYIHKMLLQLSGNEFTAFQSAIIPRIPELLELSREGTFLLIIDNLKDEIPRILSELHSHPRSLFLYLKTVIEVHLCGTLDFSSLRKNENETVDVSDGSNVRDSYKELEIYLKRFCEFPKFIRNNPVNVTDDMIELYLELLCKYERNSVLRFLETFDSYRVEHCLRLCQEYGIIDAAAFLLERVGDAASALSLTLSGLHEKFIELENASWCATPKSRKGESASLEQFNSVLELKEVHDIHDVLQACIGLCQRNTPRLNPEESETLWFRLLDTFCEPLMDSYRDQRNFDGINKGPMVAKSLEFHDDEGAHTIKWKIPRFHPATHTLRKLFSQFIKEIVEGMIGFVRLPTIMSKLLSENGSQEFGDFKLTILGMLGTYGFERRILDTAKSLIEDDTFYTMSLLKKGASHGYAPRSFLCCICNCPLTKNSSTLRVRVFNCGHATHLQCELSDIEASSSVHASSSGCPVCMPKKNTQASRSESFYPDYGLISTVSSNARTSQRTAPYSYENDTADNFHGQQISRFEILANLKKDQRSVQVENMPQLRLAPPAMYHEKVNRVTGFATGESRNKDAKVGKPAQNGIDKKMKAKGSIFRPRLGKEKTSRR